MKWISKTVMLMTLALSFTFASCTAQINNPETVILKVYGNCGMCKKTIEAAANEPGEAKADWNKDTKMLQLTYDKTKTTSDAVLQRIAEAGYDSEKFYGSTTAYDNLPECCQYERRPSDAVSAVSDTGNVEVIESTTAAQTQTPVPAAETPKTPTKTDTTPPNTSANVQFNTVLTAYLELKNALVKSEGVAAAAAGNAMMKAVEVVDMKQLSAAQHSVWMKYEKQLSQDAGKIKASTNVEIQRDHFMKLSQNFYEVAKAFNVHSEELYYQFCPMANDGKGAYWLSEQPKVQNPYYGKAMLTCGSTKETLPAVKQ